MKRCECCCNCTCHFKKTPTSKIVRGKDMDYKVSGSRMNPLRETMISSDGSFGDAPGDWISITPVSHESGEQNTIFVERWAIGDIYAAVRKIGRELDKI